MFTTVIRELTGKEVISDEMTFYIKSNSYGAVAMTKEWVESNMIIDEEELSVLIANAMPPKMKNYLER
ncbi:TetR-like C-terminal domain-containing protein [Virgibacillus oceani]